MADVPTGPYGDLSGAPFERLLSALTGADEVKIRELTQGYGWTFSQTVDSKGPWPPPWPPHWWYKVEEDMIFDVNVDPTESLKNWVAEWTKLEAIVSTVPSTSPVTEWMVGELDTRTLTDAIASFNYVTMNLRQQLGWLSGVRASLPGDTNQGATRHAVLKQMDQHEAYLQNFLDQLTMSPSPVELITEVRASIVSFAQMVRKAVIAAQESQRFRPDTLVGIITSASYQYMVNSGVYMLHGVKGATPNKDEADFQAAIRGFSITVDGKQFTGPMSEPGVWMQMANWVFETHRASFAALFDTPQMQDAVNRVNRAMLDLNGKLVELLPIPFVDSLKDGFNTDGSIGGGGNLPPIGGGGGLPGFGTGGPGTGNIPGGNGGFGAADFPGSAEFGVGGGPDGVGASNIPGTSEFGSGNVPGTSEFGSGNVPGTSDFGTSDFGGGDFPGTGNVAATDIPDVSGPASGDFGTGDFGTGNFGTGDLGANGGPVIPIGGGFPVGGVGGTGQFGAGTNGALPVGVPEGSALNPDGSFTAPDGTIYGPDGTPIGTVGGVPAGVPDGSVLNPDGTFTAPDGTTYGADGLPTTVPEGSALNPDGTFTAPDGTTYGADGLPTTVPEGSALNPDGTFTAPDGTTYGADGTPVGSGSGYGGLGTSSTDFPSTGISPGEISGVPGVATDTPTAGQLAAIDASPSSSPQPSSNMAGMGSGMPFMPMPPGAVGGNGNQKRERERQTWLTEDERVWGTDPRVGPSVIGRFDDDDFLGDDAATAADAPFVGPVRPRTDTDRTGIKRPATTEEKTQAAST